MARCHNPCIVFADSPELKLVQPGGGDGEKVGGRTDQGVVENGSVGVGDSRISDGERRQQALW